MVSEAFPRNCDKTKNNWHIPECKYSVASATKAVLSCLFSNHKWLVTIWFFFLPNHIKCNTLCEITISFGTKTFPRKTFHQQKFRLQTIHQQTFHRQTFRRRTFHRQPDISPIRHFADRQFADGQFAGKPFTDRDGVSSAFEELTSYENLIFDIIHPFIGYFH